MNEIVLDASAVLAVIQHERGAEKLPPEVLNEAVISTVNLAEVQSKLIKNGYAPACGGCRAIHQ
jgi:PIN domain nuclease of toxin-antitoxin system